MSRLIDLGGQVFGRLTVVDRAENNRHGQTMWECVCGCGREVTVCSMSLRNGDTQSCGCVRREVMAVSHRHHGHAQQRDGTRPSPTYVSWRAMLARCYDSSHPYFHNYGGRGITVCDRWRYSFKAFLSDVGTRPSVKHSIDRYPNNDGDYEPGNVRWATRTEQNRNRRTVRKAEGGISL